MKKFLAMTAVVVMAAISAQAQNCPEGLSIDNDYNSSQAGYYYTNLVKGQNVTVTLSETNFVFKVYDHGGKNGNYSSDYSGNSQSMTINAPEGCVFVVSGTINEIHGAASDRFELFDGQNSFYFYNGDDWAGIPNHKTTSNSLKISFSTAQATSGSGFELTVRVWDRYTEVGTASDLTSAVADGALIRLTNDITLPAYLSIGYDRNQNVSIDQTVTLDLNGHTLRRNLNAADADGHVIEVHSKGNLTIIDSSGNNSGTISGGWANNGGGICNYGTVNFIGGTITGCKAAQQGGGIKNNANATLTITGGVITGNRAPNGGGIYNIENGTLNISGGTFSSNTASVDGGGIANRGTASINNASIQNNTATSNGGGVWNCGTMTLGDAVTISDNNALNGGGIFLTGESNAALSGTTIRDNTSTVGGGILMDQNTVTSLTDCTITGNNATVYGGGGIVNYGSLTLHGSTITGNSCVMQGGGIWNGGSISMAGTVTVTDNVKPDGWSSNLYCTNDHVITVTGDLGSSCIYVSHEGNDGYITSDYKAHNATTSHFRNDYPEACNLGLDNNEAKLTRRTDVVCYVRRSWDGSKVVQTMETVATGNTTTLSGKIDGKQEFTSGTWLVVKDNNVERYDIVAKSGTVNLILCDGAKLISDLLIEDGATLNVYGQRDNSGTVDGFVRVRPNQTLNIHGGDISANAKDYSGCAGIGGDSYHSCGNINIYGGTVTAQGGKGGAGIGSGYKKSNNTSSGNIKIYGGTVRATGGYYDSGQSGAGIGGGGQSSGETVTIYGGFVVAWAGDDAAGIGSGEEATIGTLNIDGGNITIYGGEVYACGKDEGAGIGAGQNAALGIVNLLGGRIDVWGGDNSYAICGDDATDGNKSLTIGDHMKVEGGDYLSSRISYSAEMRVLGCINKYALLTPCDHSGATYTVSGTEIGDTHTMHCSYCKYSPTATHTFEDGICTVCHVSGSVSTVSIYLPEKVGESYTDGHYASEPRTQTLVTGSTFELPAPPVTYLPSGVMFAGWHEGTPDGLTSYWIGANEPILEPGTSYTLSADVSLTARYKGIDISLSNDANNYETLYDYNGKIAQTVTLSGRTLTKNGDWNTLCLPFDVNIADSPLAGDGVVAKVFDNTSSLSDAGVLTLKFSAAPATITAGTPFIIKWNNTGGTIENPVFTGVTITSTSPTEVTSNDTHVKFVGQYSPFDITADNINKILYVASGNKIGYSKSARTLKSCRAHFWVQPNGTPEEPAQAAARTIIIDWGESTGISSITPDPSPKCEGSCYYTLDGRRLSGVPTQRGVYIVKGKKIVVK